MAFDWYWAIDFMEYMQLPCHILIGGLDSCVVSAPIFSCSCTNLVNKRHIECWFTRAGATVEEDHENHEMPRSGSSFSPRLPQKSALNASLKETRLTLHSCCLKAFLVFPIAPGDFLECKKGTYGFTNVKTPKKLDIDDQNLRRLHILAPKLNVRLVALKCPIVQRCLLRDRRARAEIKFSNFSMFALCQLRFIPDWKISFRLEKILHSWEYWAVT